MKQSRFVSMVEASASTAVGFVVSLLVWRYVVRPIFGYDGSVFEDLAITIIFTIASVLRCYLIRRLFERGR